MLKRFFAVTEMSVYEIKSDNKAGGSPEVKKIIQRGESSVSVGQCLEGGTMVAICKFIIMYFPEKYGFASPMSGVERKIEMVSTQYWGGCTSNVVALFKTKKEAQACSESADLQPCDPRWIKETKGVLDAIGKNHPKFEVCRYNGLALPCAI